MFLKKKKKKPLAYSFKCPSSAAAKHIWKCAVEQQYFYKLVAMHMFQHFHLLFDKPIYHTLGQVFKTSPVISGNCEIGIFYSKFPFMTPKQQHKSTKHRRRRCKSFICYCGQGSSLL